MDAWPFASNSISLTFIYSQSKMVPAIAHLINTKIVIHISYFIIKIALLFNEIFKMPNRLKIDCLRLCFHEF